jgi:hypothetical protein
MHSNRYQTYSFQGLMNELAKRKSMPIVPLDINLVQQLIVESNCALDYDKDNGEWWAISYSRSGEGIITACSDLTYPEPIKMLRTLIELWLIKDDEQKGIKIWEQVYKND